MTVRVKPGCKKMSGDLGAVLDVNAWQIEGIVQALAEAENPDAVFIDHDEVLGQWESKKCAHSCASIGAPNAETVAAMRELEEGKGKFFASVNDLLADLTADD